MSQNALGQSPLSMPLGGPSSTESSSSSSSSGSGVITSLGGVLVASAQSMPIGTFSGNSLKRFLTSFFLRSYLDVQSTLSFKFNGVALPAGLRVTKGGGAIVETSANAFSMNAGPDGRAMLIDCILDLRSGSPRMLTAFATQYAANGGVSLQVEMILGKTDSDFTSDITGFSLESDTPNTFGVGSAWKSWQLPE